MKVPMTPKGYESLRSELLKLKGSRSELSNAIEVARAHGDLSENADYDAAKEKSGMVEAKIRHYEAKLSMAEVIDPSQITDKTRVVFGVTVEIEDLDTGEKKELTIVGEDESDVKQGRISFQSPLAKGLIGKEAGDVAMINLPSGKKEYEVLQIL